MYDSEDNDDRSDCYSDQIDSETEVMLYSAIHHSFAAEDQQLTSESRDSGIASSSLTAWNQSEEKSSDSNKSKQITEQNSKEGSTKNVSQTPLSNIFQLLNHKLDIDSDKEDHQSVDMLKNNEIMTKTKVDYIEISDSSDDSDVIIIDNSPVKSKNSKNAKHLSQKVTANTNISLGNVNNLDESRLSEMDRFYNEDSYDSGEEAKNYDRMSNDRQLWKISHTDLLVANRKTNRYYRNKFLCNNCNERGHQKSDCPLPKKVAVCYLCGQSGHKAEKCRSLICSLCLSRGHKTINCNQCVNQLVCDECGVRGHRANQCTYNWRKYHLTTDSTAGEPTIGDVMPNMRKCCYNCGAIGKHYGFECRSKPFAEKRLSPVSPLMSNSRKSHCFNGSKANNRRNDCNQKALCNEFVKNISSNQLSPHLSASFNKPLDVFDWVEDVGPTAADSVVTTARTFNNKNKHIKWVYPEMSRTHSPQSSASYGCAPTRDSPNKSNSEEKKAKRTSNQKSRALAAAQFCQASQQTILRSSGNALASGSASASPIATLSAHTLSQIQEINNSMRDQSHTKTQTIPKPKERSKRRRNRPKKRKFVETKNGGNGQRFIGSTNSSNFKPNKRFRRFKISKKKIKKENQ